ncbi:RNA-binding domain-containing protein [Hypoxylon cercidicola]|nr:RNA-binding domain-containing protein [Hypoxylon cercidicola]
MSYPPPPGSNSSLPPRPPPSRVSGFKPAFSPSAPPTHTPSPGAITARPYAPTPPPAYSSAPSYAGAPASHYGAPPSSSYQPYARPGSVNGGGGGGYQQHPPAAAAAAANPYQYPGQQQGGPGTGYQQPSYYGAPPATAAAGAAAASSYAAAPQIRNPFPAPSQARSNDDYDPEMAAQIAQWQSAYVKDPSREGTGTPGAAAPARPNGSATTTYAAEPTNAAAAAAAAAAAQAAGGTEKKKTVVRSGGGQKWTDDTLLEWDPSHLRLFVGNLAGETTDESLYKAFSQWRSLQKARVIRDKVTSKSKGYGFVSFSDPDEFFSAAKEMNGKYIQSHPVVVRKSTTEIKPTASRDKNGGGRWNNRNNKNKHKNHRGASGGGGGGGGGGNGSGGGGGGKEGGSFEPHLGPVAAGVHKPGQKTKGGLKLLG